VSPARTKRRAWLGAGTAVGVAGLIALIVILTTRDSGGSARVLSHTAVERYIESNLGAHRVICNGGADVEMTADGQTFTCTAAGSQTFRVTIANKDTGSYLVR
jgi:hypothetical protein